MPRITGRTPGVGRGGHFGGSSDRPIVTAAATIVAAPVGIACVVTRIIAVIACAVVRGRGGAAQSRRRRGV
jgi:hypothetical protein